ncbi:hypothetical protein BV22DRAFT_831534 [Leucogyrophana mollusca]|uniref:Uncharacterized protein n=1 Tax=Leucogyrophana mollusca TaxID=85980 RepID=A0ACB8B3B5_9AGAM|nr:hypothetical protein BV22DRAFT_831534 [Leucogyrophana mollusca]
MQAILLTRAYALCNCSKRILAFLLVCFSCQAITVLVITGMLFNFPIVEKYIFSVGPLVGSVFEGFNADFSVLQPLLIISIIVQLAFDAVLLAIALFVSVKHGLQSRRLNKGWSVNPLVKALIADQTLYFVWFAVWQATAIPEWIPNSTAGGSAVFSGFVNVFNGLAVIAGPRMVISLRAQETKTREGTLCAEMSTIQFGARVPPYQSVGEGEPKPLVDDNQNLDSGHQVEMNSNLEYEQP